MPHPKPGEPSSGRLGSGLIRGHRLPHFDTRCHMGRQKAHNGLVVETDMTFQKLTLADEVEAAPSRISDFVILAPPQICQRLTAATRSTTHLKLRDLHIVRPYM